MKQEILETVQENPGIHFRGIQREVDCSSTTLNYHINDLDFRERDIRGYRRFYPQKIPEKFDRSLAALNHDVRGLMLYQMKEGVSQKALVGSLDLSKSTVSSHLKVLKEDGLVEEERDGRSKTLFLSDSASKALSRFASDILDEASDGFIEMWE